MLAPLLIAEILLGHIETGTPGHALEVRAGPCHDGFRPLDVRLLVDGTVPSDVTATMPEPWSTALCNLKHENDGWTALEEDLGMFLTVRDAPVGQGAHGVLLSVEGGFDHVHRSHALFIEVDGVARRVWSDGDSMGRAVSSAKLFRDGIDFEFVLTWGPEGVDEHSQPSLEPTGRSVRRGIARSR
jgi:hypothetical protein